MKQYPEAALLISLAVLPALASAKVQGTGVAIADVTLGHKMIEQENRAADEALYAARHGRLTASPSEQPGCEPRDRKTQIR